MNHDVPSRRNLHPVAPQNFADAAFNAVPHHRAAQSLLNADPEAADAAARKRFCGRKTFARSFPPDGLIRNRSLRAEENGKLRTRASLAGAVNGFVFHALQQTYGAGKTLPRFVRRGGRLRISRWA